MVKGKGNSIRSAQGQDTSEWQPLLGDTAASPALVGPMELPAPWDGSHVFSCPIHASDAVTCTDLHVTLTPLP